MNTAEFAALKAGDKIVNGMNGSRGEVVSTNERGVSVRWGVSSMEFEFTIQSTAWMHWSKPNPETQP